MNIFFTTLSVAYIAGIFLFADSTVVSDIATFNPFSLLHIPLYGILTLLLHFSFSPFKGNPLIKANLFRFLIVGLIASGVAIADEIHQVYIPGRDASTVDVLLDILGISLCIFLIQRIKHSSA
jgi:VanZ family protein